MIKQFKIFLLKNYRAPIIWRLFKFYSEIKLQSEIKNKPTSFVFNKIFKNNLWNDRKSVSGPGSNDINTANLRNKLYPFLKKHHISSMLDAPCGDFYWMQKIELYDIDYLGGDIVKEIIDINNSKFKTEKIKFIQIDITKDPLPEFDLIFVRDCLVHFEEHLIFLFINNLKKSRIKYLLTTNFPLTKNNYNITTRNWRAINLK